MAKCHITHGQFGTPLYAAWCNMKYRTAHEPLYAAVAVDARWATFEGFIDHPPAGEFHKGMCLGRIGDVGPYSPENTRWQTKTESSRESVERRMTRLPDGRFADDVARENGIHKDTWHKRIGRGWDPLAAVTTPAKNKGRNRTIRTTRQPARESE